MPQPKNDKAMSKETTQAIGQLDAERIEALKRKHGRIYEVLLDDGHERHVAYFRRPDMQTLTAMTKLAKTDEIRASQVLLEECFVEGSQAVKHDTALFMAAVGELGKVLTSVRAEIKNV